MDKFCQKCGNELEQGISFCSKCGNPVAEKNVLLQAMPAQGIAADFRQSSCYYSTPRHNKSLVGIFIYIYVSKGTLTFNSGTLFYESKKGSFQIPMAAVTEIGTGHYSRLAKPVRLDFITVKYRTVSGEETVYLTPTISWATTVWETNKIVADWIAFLNYYRGLSQ